MEDISVALSIQGALPVDNYTLENPRSNKWLGFDISYVDYDSIVPSSFPTLPTPNTTQ